MATQLLARDIRSGRCGDAAEPTRWSRVGLSLSAAATVLVSLLLAAPPAGATVRQVSVTPDLNAGIRTNYGTGCSYTVRAWLTEAVTEVTFLDNGVPFATVGPDGGGLALVHWVPAYEGDHTLQAVQPTGGSDPAPYVRVFVGRGEHIGYACWVS
ncbi:hypothetical protein [Nocardia grenadensis]|uniref:hypothetical protein n=1 Tax=Nocardia grenadensis TaxID=931537 RepID=UPI000AF6739B|nr:hypothetical protein [Nocardia grenadensis]